MKTKKTEPQPEKYFRLKVYDNFDVFDDDKVWYSSRIYNYEEAVEEAKGMVQGFYNSHHRGRDLKAFMEIYGEIAEDPYIVDENDDPVGEFRSYAYARELYSSEAKKTLN
jgi:hypothetical protein